MPRVLIVLFMLIGGVCTADEYLKVDGNLKLTAPTKLIFNDNEYKPIMEFIFETGDVYWRSRLVTTDKELVEGLRDIITEGRCPKCKELK